MTLPPDLSLLDSAGKDALTLALVERLNDLTGRIDALEATPREAATPPTAAIPARPRPRARPVAPAPSAPLRPPINIAPTVQGRGD